MALQSASKRSLNTASTDINHIDCTKSGCRQQDQRGRVHTRCFTRDITERKQAEEREREHQKQVATELADMRRLQEISTRLIQESNGGLYDGILDAAVSLLRSDMASMQMFDPAKSKLRLLGARGFDSSDIGSFE